MGTGARVSHLPTTMNDNTMDYEDFPDLVPFLESTASKEDNRIYASPKKRYRKFVHIFALQTILDLTFFRDQYTKHYSQFKHIFLVGIDIPDYISSGGNPEAIKNMSSKLKALGKRRRK